MSHYTSIKTKYTNSRVLKEAINKLGYPFVEHHFNKNIEVSLNFSGNLKSSIYDNSQQNYLGLKKKDLSYNIITDHQSWTEKEVINIFLKKLELNYGYSETINQAIGLGFVRSKVLTANNKNNRFVFQRYVEVKC